MQAVSDFRMLQANSHLSAESFAYIESLYESYLSNPDSVSAEWRSFFSDMADRAGSDYAYREVREKFAALSLQQNLLHAHVHAAGGDTNLLALEIKQARVSNLIQSYRINGHRHADLDPLGLWQRAKAPDLSLEYHKLSVADLDTVFHASGLFFPEKTLPLKSILAKLQQTYCGTIGTEFMHVLDTEQRAWLYQHFESVLGKPAVAKEVQCKVLNRLTAAEGMERYLGSRYPGTKRFSLEGAGALLPLLDELIYHSGNYDIVEVVMGMAHRGRLNILVNILGKSPAELFDEFEGKKVNAMGSGDVKYHQGFSSNVTTARGNEVHLAMAFNPSHLEIVAPVVVGSVRARQDRREDSKGDFVIPVIMHGDAAFAGQGVVMETFQMSQLRGFRTGGSIHIVINNQVGFTTSDLRDARSTEYCTDIAKVVQAPILHVNADDPEAVIFAARFALDYRMTFKQDIVIDLICYRRRGHNEADEPSVTQPLMYKKIATHPTVREIYAQKLIEEGTVTSQEAKDYVDQYRATLEKGASVTSSLVTKPDTSLFVDWTPYLGHEWSDVADTGFDKTSLLDIAAKLSQVPEGFVLQKQVAGLMANRAKMAAAKMPVDWGFAENLAYATLLQQGYHVRITGQDSARGTFAHRHARLNDQNSGETLIPLKTIAQEEEHRFQLFDSFLSEEAVLAFEYGYSSTSPITLVVWEAQFGDFANGAQVVIDQFITSGEIKWERLSGLVLLLPHGYEGQGPEHSSARLERFMQLCAEHNIQVCIPSTPAQVFHMLRRQMVRNIRKPLVVMSPKSLLRHKLVVSDMDDLAHGSFQTVLPEQDITIVPEAMERVVLCSGKVYYDLLQKRQTMKIKNTAIIRIEQVYPFPHDPLISMLQIYTNIKTLIWCQEEPMNQGIWYCSQHNIMAVARRINPKMAVHFAGRESSAAPATGYVALHKQQQEALLEQAMTL